MHQTVIKSLCRGDVKWCFIMIMNLEIKLWLLVYYNSRFTLNIIALSNIKSATWGVFCWTIYFFLTSSINISFLSCQILVRVSQKWNDNSIFLYNYNRKRVFILHIFLIIWAKYLCHLDYTVNLANKIFTLNVAQILIQNTLP